MPIKLLRIATGVFFILIGLAGVLTQVEEGAFSLNNDNILLEQIVGLVEIACGVILLAGLGSFRTRTLATASLVVLIFWVLRIIVTNFVFASPFALGFTGLIGWGIYFSMELVIAAAIYILVKVYD
jgi:hypothetical protein